jgi:elongation factor P
VTEDRVRAGADIDIVPTETRSAQFLYKTDDGYHFMDNESFDQIELSAEDVGESMRFIRENESVDLLVIQDENDRSSVIDVAPPNFVTIKVIEADVAVRGDTATNLQKNVTLETGTVIQAPAFIKVGDLLRIDTRSGEYVERAKQ